MSTTRTEPQLEHGRRRPEGPHAEQADRGREEIPTEAQDAVRFAEVCTNSGKCIPACDYGVNPRFMVNMARIAAKATLGEDVVRHGAKKYFNTMNRSTRMISRLLLPPEVHARLNPPLLPDGAYPADPPDIVFYSGCNVIKTPHIALLILDVLDAIGVTYEVMGGASTCCGIQHFKQGDAKISGRVDLVTGEDFDAYVAHLHDAADRSDRGRGPLAVQDAILDGVVLPHELAGVLVERDVGRRARRRDVHVALVLPVRGAQEDEVAMRDRR